MTNYLSEATALLLREEAVLAEQLGCLTPKQLDIIYQYKWFNLFVPTAFGGLELDLVEGLQIQEQLAALDGSLGWTVTLVSGANAFFGFFEPEQRALIYNHERVCCAGSGAIKGVAREIEGGYLINGQWNYVTGAAHATIFTANCHIEREGQLVVDQSGTPIYKSFFFTAAEVNPIRDWNGMGMKATSSHSFSVTDLKVSLQKAFSIAANATYSNLLIYQYPFAASAILTITANHLGMHRHFLELAKPILYRDKNTDMLALRQQLWVDAHTEFQRYRTEFYRLANSSWLELQESDELSEQCIQQIQLHCKTLVKEGREALLKIYPHLGMMAANKETELNRVLRDLLTASQHSILL